VLQTPCNDVGSSSNVPAGIPGCRTRTDAVQQRVYTAAWIRSMTGSLVRNIDIPGGRDWMVFLNELAFD
jgi:hypothetical protein